MKTTKIVFNLLLFSLFFAFKLASFNNLTDITAYSNSIPEYPKIDNQDYLIPDFSSFYKKSTLTPTNRLLSKVFNFLKIKKELWSPEQFKSLLKKVTELQEKNWGIGDYVIKNTPINKTKFVIWGDIQGAFHSLERDLKKLTEENYLDNELKILNPDCFFVFNGNVIGRSAYIMETLTVILSLIEKNPKQVIYIKGAQELNDNWKNFGLEQELRYKATQISKESIPLESEITKFLNTLPLALYIKLPSDKIQKFIRISYFDRNFVKLNEFSFSEFLQKNSNNNIDVLNLTDKKTSDQQISIEAIIEGKDRSLQYQKTDGLQLLLPDMGATAWSIFSCPTLSSQKLYNFSNDAFAILTVDPKEKLNLITLYKQNAIDPKGFSTKTYNILSEELIKEEAVKQEKATTTKEEKIIIGSSLDLFGVSYLSMKQLYEGLNLFFKKLNSSGGIKGKEVNNIVLNDQYKPTLVNKNINTFLNAYKTSIILVIGGTPTTKAVLPRVEAKEILVAFPYTGASIFRKPELKYFIHMKTSYEKESLALTEYAIKQMNLTKLAIFYQDDDFGVECLNGAREALEKNGIKSWIQAAYKNETTDIEDATKKIIEFNPQAIMLFSREKPALSLIDNLGTSVAANKTFFAGSYMSDEFKEKLKEKSANLVLSSTVPNPRGTELEIQKEYQQVMQATSGKEISINTASFTGYIYAAVFSELLQRIDGKITKEKIIEQAEKIKNENFKGLILNFDPETRELFKGIWINTLEDKWVKPGEIEAVKPTQKETPKPMLPEEKSEIKVGLNIDLTNVLALETKPTLDGLTDCIREENKTNKMNNIKITILDNKLDPTLIESNTEKFLENGIKIFLHPTGSFILEKMLPILKDKPVFILNGSQSPIFRKSDLKNIINYFPSSFQSASILTQYLIEKHKDKKIAIIYQKEPYGQGAYEGCSEIFKKNNIQENIIWKAFGHTVGKTDDSNIIDSIKKFNPEILFIISYDTAIKDFLKNFGADFLINKIIATIDISGEMKDFINKQNLNYISTQIIPDLTTSDFELVKEYRKLIGNKKPDERYFEGYLTANILIHLINKISGEITPQKLLQAAENIKNENLKGFTLNFDSNTRSIMSEIWIEEGGKIFQYQGKQEEAPSEKIITEKRNIVVGSNLDLTTVMAEESKPTIKGILSAFHEENKKSQFNNIKFTCNDNKFQIDLIKDYTQKMLDNGINIFLQPTGSFILEKMLPLIKDKPILMLCGATSPIFRKPELKNFINYFPSSFQSAKALAEYLIVKLNKQKIAVIYQLEPYGQGAFDGCEYVFKKYNLKKDIDWIAFGHQAEEISNPKVIDAIKKFNPDALIFATYNAALRDLVNNLGSDFLFKRIIGTIEISGEIKDFLDKKHISFVSTQLALDAKTSNLEIAKEYLKIGHEEISPRSLEGYVGASILIHLINKIEGEVTPQKLLNVAENLKNENLKGLILNFEPQTRSILSDVWIDTGDGKPFIYKETEEKTIKKEIAAPLKTEATSSAKKEILVGTTLDLSKSNSVWGKAILSGLNLSINKTNRNGGVNGKHIKLIHFDNKNDPKIARENAENILLNGSDLILHPVANLTIEAYLPLAKENKLAIILSASSAATLYKPEPRNMTSFYPSSTDAAKVITEYAIKECNLQKLAVFFQTEPYSLSALEGAKEIFGKYNLIEGKDWIAVSHIQDSLDLTQATNKIKEFNPSAIFLFSVYSPNQALISQLGTDFLYNKILFGLESDGKIINFIRKQNLKFATTQLLPSPESNLKIAQEYRNEKKESNVLNDTEFGAFLACEIFVDILKKIKEPITKEKIIEAIENIKNENFKGINLNFDFNTRKILPDVWINTIDGSIIAYKIPESKNIEPSTEVFKKEEKPLSTVTTTPLISEKKPETITTNNEIKVGCTLDQNGKTAEYIKSFALGIKTKISKVNSTGGINGKTINLIIRDDEFIPGRARENIEKFLSEDKTDIILSPFGSFPFTEILPFIKEQKIAVFFPEATSPDYQKKEYKNLVTCFGSSYQESKILFEYIINKLKIKKIAIFYEEEPFSQGAFNGAKEVLEKNNMKENVDWKVFPREIKARTSTKEIIEALQNFDPEGIALLSLQSITQALILDIPRDYLASKKCFGISSMSKIKKMLEDRGFKFISTQLVPDPINSTIDLVKEYRKDMSEKGFSLGTYSLEGYFAASIFVDLLKKVEGNITKEKIIEQAEKIKNYDFKGLPLNFDPNTRNIFGCVFLDTKEGEPILYKPEVEKPKEVLPEKTTETKPVKSPAQKETTIEKPITAASAPTTKEDFIVGNSMDLSKGGAYWGKANLRGIILSINKTNKEGGVNGRKMKLINYDDKDDPNLAFENVQNIINKNIDFIIHPFGSTSIHKYLPFIKENKIAVIFSACSDDALYKPEPRFLTNFFLSSKDTAKALTEYAIKELNLKKFAVFYEMGSYSQSALNGAIEIFKKFNLQEGKDWIAEGHQPDTIDILPSANKIKDFSPQGILLFAVYQAHTSLVDLLGAAFLNNRILLPLESDGEIIKALKKRNFKFATTQTLPSIDSEIEAAKQFKEELNKQDDDKSLKFLDTTFSAFVATELFVDIVKNLQKPITKENVIEAIEKIKDRDFRGIKINFNPQTRAVLKHCYIYTTDEKVIPYSTDETILSTATTSSPQPVVPEKPKEVAPAATPTTSKAMAKNSRNSILITKRTNTKFVDNKKLQKRKLLT